MSSRGGGERLKTEDYMKSLASLYPDFQINVTLPHYLDLLPFKTHLFSTNLKNNQNKGIWPPQIKDAYNKNCQVKHNRTMRY